jgi:hypothetical protein
MADNLPPLSADVTESGSLKLPESSGSHRPVMGLLYLLLLLLRIRTTILNTSSVVKTGTDYAQETGCILGSTCISKRKI